MKGLILGLGSALLAIIATVIVLLPSDYEKETYLKHKRIEGCLLEHRATDQIYDSCVDILFEDEICSQ